MKKGSTRSRMKKAKQLAMAKKAMMSGDSLNESTENLKNLTNEGNDKIPTSNGGKLGNALNIRV